MCTVGMYSLNRDEYSMFGADFQTAQVATSTEDHIVVVDMFHQLHCLVGSLSLRERRDL